MKTKQKKQSDLEALTENFKNSNAAMVLSFTKLTVEKDQQFRNEIRETGAKYGVVKNTLARLAVKGTPFEEAMEHFNGVTSVIWSNGEPVDLSKVISKYVKTEKDIFEFKTGIVDGKVIDFSDVVTIASLPSKDELIGKLLFLINAPAQRLATVLSAIPRDLAAVVKQVSEREGDTPAEETAPEAKTAEEPAPEASAKEATPETETPQEAPPKAEAADEAGPEASAKETAPEAETAEEAPEAATEEETPKATDEKNSEPEETSADKDIEKAEPSENEEQSAGQDASVEEGTSEAASDSSEEGGGEPAGDESK